MSTCPGHWVGCAQGVDGGDYCFRGFADGVGDGAGEEFDGGTMIQAAMGEGVGPGGDDHSAGAAHGAGEHGGDYFGE